MSTSPQPDRESAPFWAALQQHKVVVQECSQCGRRRFPRTPSCPYCAADGGADVELPGTGLVYSWVRVERALSAEMVGEVPYCIATVDLDGGARLQGRLEPPSAAVIGLAVGPRFVDREGWTELRFTPVP